MNRLSSDQRPATPSPAPLLLCVCVASAGGQVDRGLARALDLALAADSDVPPVLLGNCSCILVLVREETLP
eukprot:scaffold276149_cov29-Tisochrysis_lutea.AAC.1